MLHKDQLKQHQITLITLSNFLLLNALIQFMQLAAGLGNGRIGRNPPSGDASSEADAGESGRDEPRPACFLEVCLPTAANYRTIQVDLDNLFQ